MKTKYTFFLLFFFCSTITSYSSVVTGKIVEQSTKEPMEFVNIALYQDSTLLKGVLSDKDGAFSIFDIKEGNYFLEISFIGFETIKTPIFSIAADVQIDKGIISISPSIHTLGGVEVSEEKSLMETAIDKKIYNVGKDIMSTSGSVSQILENIPSVSVGVDGIVTLRGSANVTILINGRPSSMMRLNSANALQQIPASTIERIEIITNPSAKYKPDGTAGIINIVLKKDTKMGLNGTLTANAGTNDRYNSSISLNYKPGKLNIYGNYGFRQDYRIRTSTDFRLIRDSSQNLISKYDYNNVANYRPQSHTASLGMDYDINSKNTIGVSGDYFYVDFLQTEEANTSISDSSEQIINNFNRNRLNNEYEWDKEIAAYLEHKFKKEDHTLNFELNLTDHYEQESNKFTSIYYNPSSPNTYDNTIIGQKEKGGEAVVEYANAINEDVEIEIGYTTEWINQDFNFYGERFEDSLNTWIKDIGKSNQFKFGQIINSGYITYAQSIEDFGVELGLRGENADITSNLITLDSVVKQNYFKLYPTIHLSLEMSDNAEVQLSYSKRVERPEGDELNPFPEYDDPRNLYAGNPLLKPEQIHSIELGYQFKNDTFTFVPSIYYKYKYDGFTEVSKYINDTTLLTTVENLSSSQYAGLEMIFAWRFKKILTMNLSGNLFYNEIDASNLGYSKKKSSFAGNLKLGASINITKSTALQLNANYRSSELTPQGKNLSGYSLNLGLRQNLFKDRVSLLLTVSDVFNSMRWQSEIDTPVLYQKTSSKRKSQIVYLGFSYRFGKVMKKNAEDLKFDEAK